MSREVIHTAKENTALHIVELVPETKMRKDKENGTGT
jgi:hypothetical protein